MSKRLRVNSSFEFCYPGLAFSILGRFTFLPSKTLNGGTKQSQI